MRSLMVFILMGMPLVFIAQGANLSGYEADSVSYSLYLEGNATELESLVKRAAEEGIDFYYLRMRIGILDYNRKKYTVAEEHFKKALSFYPADTLALEYLFYALLYQAKNLEASALFEEMQEPLRKKLSQDKPLNYAFIAEGGFMSSNASKQYNLRTVMPPPYRYGEADASDNMVSAHVGFLSHYENRTALYFGFSYLNLGKQQDFYFANSKGPQDTTFTYNYHQYDYYLGVNHRTKGNGFLRFGFHYFDYTSNYNYSVQDTMLHQVSFYNIPLKENNWMLNLGFLKQFGPYIKTTADVAFGSVNQAAIFQGSARLHYFPFGSLNFYGSTGVSINTDSTENRMVIIQTVGGKIAKRTWLDASLYAGNLKNLCDENAYLIYNVSDKISAKAGAGITWFANRHLELSFRYFYIIRKAFYSTEVSANTIRNTNYNYTNNSITGGIKWKF